MIKKKEITQLRSFEYLRKELCKGRTLCKLLAELPIEAGQVHAFVPTHAPIEKLFEFESGAIYPFDQEVLKTTNLVPVRKDARKFVIREIQKYLSKNSRHCCLFQDPVYLPSDGWVLESGIQYLHLNNEEMFYFFNKRVNQIAKIEEAFIASENYIFTCALSSLSTTQQRMFTSQKMISIELLNMFVANVSAFIVGAYDGEGYIMWSKAD